MTKARVKKGSDSLGLRMPARAIIKKCAHQVINKNREVFDELANH